MAPPPSRPWRTLLALTLLTAVIAGLVGWGATTDKGQWTPRLGLDLAGGTQIVLLAKTGGQEAVTEQNINEAVDIIRDRVDSLGVSESEVAAQGTNQISISVPGRQGAEILDLVQQTAQLRFRKVLKSGPGTAGPPPGQPGAPGQPAPGPGAPSSDITPNVSSPSGVVGTPDARVGEPNVAPQPGQEPGQQPGAPGAGEPQRRVVPQGLVRPVAWGGLDARSGFGAGEAPPLPSGSPAPAPSTTTAPSAAPSAATPPAPPAQPPAGAPMDAQVAYELLDCIKPEARAGQEDDPSKPLAACDQNGAVKYLLDKAELVGTDVDDAQAQPRTNDQGAVINVNDWQVSLTWTGEGQRKWSQFTAANVGNQVAVVLDGKVVSAPNIDEAINSPQTSIYGNFKQEEATKLANILRYGALPLSFDPGTVEAVSATLGGDQLRAGLIAGALGLALVVVYSLLYYRALGLVNIASLAVGALLIYLVVLGMSNSESIGLRLTLAGIAGLVIGIGIAADSFIVYFERIRDELREGKTLKLAVEIGWRRARRTILAADFVSFLAAVVLYFLAIGAVRGFAVMLGLTTIIDIIVVFFFTKPLVTILARRKFFQSGHPLSGLGNGVLRRTAGGALAAGAPAPKGLT